MRWTGRLIVLTVGCACMTAALACGDKLSVLSGGVRFERMHASQHPGRIVIFAPGGSALRAANAELHLAQLLTRAGHTVEVVDDQQRVERVLQLAVADLILVDTSDEKSFAAFVAAGSRVGLMRVSYDPKPSMRAVVADSRCVTTLTRRSSALLLRSVDDQLELSRQGKPLSCDSGIRAQKA